MKPATDRVLSLQKRQKTRRESADERYQRRVERELRRAEAKAVDIAERGARNIERRKAKIAKRREKAEQRRLKETLRIATAVAKATVKVKRETVRAIKAAPQPRKPSLKQLNQEARLRRLARAKKDRECVAAQMSVVRADRKAHRLARQATPTVPPLPYGIPPLPY